MRGGYKSGQRRVLSGSVYKIVIGVILLVAAALVVTLLAVLPAMDDTITPEKKIVSIEAVSGSDIGVGSNASLIPIRVTYSDGTKEEIILGNTTFSGLDVSTTGTQNVVLSFGGFEQTVQFNVVDINCHVSYRASVGGKIQGETDQVVPSGSDASTVIAVPETGYVFVKWNDGYPLAQRKDTGIIEKEVMRQAIFEKAKYYVRFYYDDASTVGSEELVTYGEAPTKIPSYGDDPRMDVYGYVFTGWSPSLYETVDGEQKLVSIDRNMNFYPEYVKKATDYKITVPVDKYGQSMGKLTIRGTEYEQSTVEGYFAHDQMATVLATPYNSREFAYWQVEDVDGNLFTVPKEGSLAVRVGGGGEEIAFTSTRSGSSVQDYNLSFTPNDRVAIVNIRAIFAYSASDITFVNYQNPQNNNIELKVSGLPFGTPLIRYKTDEVDLTGGLPIPEEPVGMEFDYWYELGDDTRTRLDGSETFEQPTTLVAKWTRKQYTVRFTYLDENNDEVVWHEIQVYYQDSFASGGGLPLTNPTKERYVFLGWQDAVTGNSVDDRTKLYAEAAHLENAAFLTGTLNIIPIWAPKSHTLRVDFNGSGTAQLVIDKNKGEQFKRTVSVLGEYEITEDHTYELVVEAMEGYKLVSAMWYYAGERVPYDYGAGISRTTYSVAETSDNTLTATFTPIRLTIAVANGDDRYVGLVEYNGETYADMDTYLFVRYNDNATVRIVSQNPVYYVSFVSINGVRLGNDETWAQEVREYSFVLENVKEDVDVTVVYATAQYYFNLSVGDGGLAYETDLYDRSATVVFTPQDSYRYGEEIYIRIKGDFGGSVRKYLSAMRINGVLYDLFANAHPNFKLYSYKINGVDYGIDLLYYADEYYFTYGEAEYLSTTYVFAQKTDEYKNVVLIKSESYGEVVYNFLREDAENYADVYSFLYAELDVAEKNLYNTSIVRDNRITEVDLRVYVADDYNVILSFDDVAYSVEASSDGHGEVTVSDTRPSYGGTSVLVATPDAGYYVKGYVIAGEGDFVPVNTPEKGESYRLTLNDIAADKDVAFTFEKIGYKVIFVNDSMSSGALYADGVKLNASVAKNFFYHDEVNVLITVEPDKRITEITVDGDPVTVHYNQTYYAFFLPDLTGDVIVRLRTGDKTDELADNNTYLLDFVLEEGVDGSAEYILADATVDNHVLLTASYGFTLNNVRVRDKVGGTEMPLAVSPQGQTEYAFIIDANRFTEGARVEIVATATPKQYDLTTSASEHGSISNGSHYAYGTPVSVDVIADQNCYLYAVYVNDEKISFETNYWSGLVADSVTGHYTQGMFNYVVTSDMDIRAEFRVNSYKVSVDASSVNGTTVLSVGDSVADVAPHGSYLYIGMTAEAGYHVGELYVNGNRITDLTFETEDENERTTAVYVYKGAYSAGVYSGITGRTTVKVVYEINRYYFVYNLVNDSANFNSDTNMGTLTSSYTLNGNRYYGIEHGSNFSFDVVPTISNGYYLYSLTIEYTSSLGDNTVTRYSDGEYFGKNGGTIWFNRFVDDNSGDTGVVNNIAGITAVFRRNLYSFTMTQVGEEDTGSMSVLFSHPNANVSGVYLFNGAQAEENKYYYRNGVFYQETPGGLVATDIAIEYDAGDYLFVDGLGTEYDMKVEHGLRYTLTAAPTRGYERISLTLNGTESNGFVSENRYSTNVVGAIAAVATFRIITFDVRFSTTVFAKNLTSVVPAELIANYMNISIVLLEGVAYDGDYQPVSSVETEYVLRDYADRANAEELSLFADYGVKVSYGSKIKFVMTPAFATTGYYLSQFYLGSSEIPSLLGDDPLGERSYAGALGTGYVVNANVSARCTFRIKRYSVSTEIGYPETIVGENANELVEESGGTIAWSDSASVKVVVGQGYSLQSIYVRRGTGAEQTVNLPPRDEPFNEASYYGEGFLAEMHYDYRNPLTNEVRDVLIIKNVTSDITVRAVFRRESHVFRYVFNNASLLSVTTQYNPYNTIGFPQATDVDGDTKGHWSSGVLTLQTKYYDELLSIITPVNGYRIAETTAVIRAVQYNELTGLYDDVLDNAGDPIVTTLDLVDLGNDQKRFTFHNQTSQIATLYVRYDLEVSFNVVIKTYTLTTTIDRVTPTNRENDPQITVDVRNQSDSYVTVKGSLQMPQLLQLTKDGEGNITGSTETGLTLVAEHKGSIRYSFDAPEGFYLSALSVNGYAWTNLHVDKILDYSLGDMPSSRLKMTAARVEEGGTRFYRYSLYFYVEDALIEGRNNIDYSRIVVSMQISPIVYQVKVFVNGEEREWQTLVDGSGSSRNGVTDGSTLTVYSPKTATHYAGISVEPALYEGYTITGLAVKTGVSTGISGVNDPALSSAYFSMPSDLSAINTYRFQNATLPYVNVTTDELTVYFFFTTHIVSYAVNIETYAFTLDASFHDYPNFGGGTEGTVPYDSKAGLNEVIVTTGGVQQPFASGNSYEYFSVVRSDFYAKAGYKMYSVAELIDGNYVELVNGSNGIYLTSSTDNSGTTHYTFFYTIDGRGDRSFRIVYKQETTVVIHIPNPFKYTRTVNGVNSYYSYATINAYENGVKLVNQNDNGTGKVQDTYVYTVLVGNFVSFSYTDSNRQSGQDGALFCTYDPMTEEYTLVSLYSDSRYDSYDAQGKRIDKGQGMIINSLTELYVVNAVYGRITFSKTTYSAGDDVGGDVYFNNSSIEPSTGYYAGTQTTVGQVVTITVQARENFVLSRLLVRQIDYNQSLTKGYVVFKTGIQEWLEFNESFSNYDSNGFSIQKLDGSDPAGRTVFRIVMRGDMELSFEFYRIYKVQYGVKYANANSYGVYNGEIDKTTAASISYCYPSAADQNAQEIALVAIDGNEYAPDSSAHPENDAYMYVQYDSVFTLTAPYAPEGYVFVGWYVNKYNVFSDLDIGMPSADSVENQTFYVTEQDTEGLMEKVSELSDERAEAIVLDILAVYMPVIDVVLINELYYYENGHWNSWATGAIRSEAFVYDGTSVPPDTTISTFPTTSSPKALTDITYNSDFVDAVDENGKYGWNLSYGEYLEEYALNPSTDFGDNQIYSALKNFRLLYRYIASDEYEYDYWTDATLSLNLSATPSTVDLVGWQYYNWNTASYETISYRYKDRNYVNQFGEHITIDNTYSSYEFDLAYLYADLFDNNGDHTGVPAMPYAISITTEDNTENNRPLIIRPLFSKISRLEITQIAYVEQLGSGDTIDNFSEIVHPVIRETALISEQIDKTTFMSGDFDYGTLVHVDYYDRTVDDPADKNVKIPRTFEWTDDMEMKDMNYRYRFVGWRLRWTGIADGNQKRTDFWFIQLGENGIDLTLKNEFDDDPPYEIFELQAVYVKQYRHVISSYNVAGSDDSYELAKSQGSMAYQNAPDIVVELNERNYQVTMMNLADNSLSATYVANSLTHYNTEGSKYDLCLADVGASYHLTVKATDAQLGAGEQFSDATLTTNPARCNGYDPNFDYELCRYERYERKDEHGLSYVYVNKIVPESGTHYTEDTITVTGYYDYELQYVSKAELIFQNVMYNSGIAIPKKLAQYLTGSDNLTVWDAETREWGDGNTVADGVIHFIFDMFEIKNMQGSFNYALNGFAEGKGIQAMKNLTYVYSGTKTNGNNLFNPQHESFRRYIVIDYDAGGYVEGGSQLFGKVVGVDAGVTASTRYLPSNTGIGTEESPYAIYNLIQLRNLGLYFNYNEFDCEGVHFALCKDIRLQAVNTGHSSAPEATSTAWVPLTFYYDDENGGISDSEKYRGFNGVFDGQGHSLYGLAATNANLLDRTEDSTDDSVKENPANFDYRNLEGYGIFGCVNGGTIKNLNVGNAYVNLNSFGKAYGDEDDSGSVPVYVGLLTARAYGATFTGVTFMQNGDTNGCYENTYGKGAYSRVYVNSSSASGLGLLAGYFENSTATSCVLEISSGVNCDVTLIGGATSIGGLIGIAKGDKDRTNKTLYKIENCAVIGKNNSSSLNINNTRSLSSALESVGGLVGTAKNGVYIVNARVGENTEGTAYPVTFYFGNNNTTLINVGGIVGYLDNASMSGSRIRSANTDKDAPSTGVWIYSKTSTPEESAVESLASADDYGKMGGMVGYAKKSDVDAGNNELSAIGVFNFIGAIAGGIVGVASESLIQGFNVYAPSHSTNWMRMAVEISMSSTIIATGAVVGAATSGAIINECSVVGNSGNTGNGLSNMADTVLYAFQDFGDDNDLARSSIPNNSTSPDSDLYNYAKGTTIQDNKKTYAGGIAGYLSGALYNSYTKYTRVTVRYKNGLSNTSSYDLLWAVSLGGLVGHFNVTNQNSTYFGWRSVAPQAALGDTSGDIKAYDTYLDKPVSRIQSCYSVGSSLALAGYIWCDGFSTSDYNADIGTVGATLGGIAGSTSLGKYGDYGINSCYTQGCNFIRDLGSYGYDGEAESVDDGNKGSPSIGWVSHVDKLLFIQTSDPVYYPNRAGVWVEGGIFGIVSGWYNNGSKYGGACNYCWCRNNTASVNSWPEIADMQQTHNGTSKERGLSYMRTGGDVSSAARQNAPSLRYPYLSASEGPVGSSGYFVTGCTGNLAETEATVTIGTNSVNRGNITIIFGGAFVGVYGNVDGRVYKTDIHTGLPVVAHPYIATNSDQNDNQQYTWMVFETRTEVIDGDNVDVYAPIVYANYNIVLFPEKKGYNAWRAENASAINNLLVAGQGNSALT